MALRYPIALAALLVAPATAVASPADVIEANARQSGDTWTISATIRHADTGWDHYADKFEVVAPDGTVLGTRTLFHPHVNEQPFTRSLSGVAVPEGTKSITIRAGDNIGSDWGEIREIELK